MGFYSGYSYIINKTEYVSDTEYFELTEDEETEDQHGRLRACCMAGPRSIYIRARSYLHYEN